MINQRLSVSVAPRDEVPFDCEDSPGNGPSSSKKISSVESIEELDMPFVHSTTYTILGTLEICQPPPKTLPDGKVLKDDICVQFKIQLNKNEHMETGY